MRRWQTAALLVHAALVNTSSPVLLRFLLLPVPPPLLQANVPPANEGTPQLTWNQYIRKTVALTYEMVSQGLL